MAKITKISARQWAEVDRYRDEMLGHGLSTQPADRTSAEAAIAAMYKAVGAEAPQVVWLQSPMAALLAQPLVLGVDSISSQLDSQLWSQLGSPLRSPLGSQLWSQLRSQLSSQLWSQLGSQLGSPLRSQLGSQLDSQLRSQLWSQLWSQLDSQLWSQLRSQLGSQLSSQLWSQLGSPLGSQLWSQLDSQLRSQLREHVSRGWWGNWSSWWAYYNFMPNIGVQFDADQTLKLGWWMSLFKSCGMWWSLDKYAFVSERPTAIYRDSEHRLHCENGPALAYGDGYGIWSIHGVRVPQRVVERPSELTSKEVDDEENAEIRRVMIDRMGAERYLRESGAEQVSKDHHGILWRKPVKDDEPVVMVEVENSTPEPDGSIKHYFLRVPPNMTTPTAAVAWTFGLSEKEYKPAKET